MKRISGIGASSGKVKGKVWILKNEAEIENFPAGYILVAEYTNPSMVPALINAKAVITDKGGMICHTAIVSRELGIPCVVGTKCATRILKNNDEVEVDGEKGEVMYEP